MGRKVGEREEEEEIGWSIATVSSRKHRGLLCIGFSLGFGKHEVGAFPGFARTGFSHTLPPYEGGREQGRERDVSATSLDTFQRGCCVFRAASLLHLLAGGQG